MLGDGGHPPLSILIKPPLDNVWRGGDDMAEIGGSCPSIARVVVLLFRQRGQHRGARVMGLEVVGGGAASARGEENPACSGNP
ncbi:hypothetical protein Tco_0763650 [Tanacetum coccineum]